MLLHQLVILKKFELLALAALLPALSPKKFELLANVVLIPA
jgi:hypothetical protein